MFRLTIRGSRPESPQKINTINGWAASVTHVRGCWQASTQSGVVGRRRHSELLAGFTTVRVCWQASPQSGVVGRLHHSQGLLAGFTTVRGCWQASPQSGVIGRLHHNIGSMLDITSNCTGVARWLPQSAGKICPLQSGVDSSILSPQSGVDGRPQQKKRGLTTSGRGR